MQDRDDNCWEGWNFGNLTGWKDTTGTTIEWRQPPGVTTAAECLGWTELAVQFVQAARGWKDIGNVIGNLYQADVDGLKRFISDRGEYPGRDTSRMDDIFRGKFGRAGVVELDRRIGYTEAYDAGCGSDFW